LIEAHDADERSNIIIALPSRPAKYGWGWKNGEKYLGKSPPDYLLVGILTTSIQRAVEYFRVQYGNCVWFMSNKQNHTVQLFLLLTCGWYSLTKYVALSCAFI